MQSTRQFFAPSDRVKSVDLHSTQPWMAVGLMNGEVNVWNYEKKEIVRTFKVCSSPVRVSVFITRKGWLVTGSDDKHVRVFDCNTGEKVKEFEAHEDFIRAIAVHPTQPIILTAGDDKLIKQWNWDNDCQLEQTYEGHSHYVMGIAINPNDGQTFASASLDNTVKVWQINTTTPSFTLEGHEKGVNCVAYSHGAGKSLIISGSDDHLVKVWDCESKKCIASLDGHTSNVTSVRFHPSLPLIISTAECLGEIAGAVRVWNAESYRLESILSDDLGRAWCVQTHGDTVAVGYDRGCVVHTITKKEHQESTSVKKTA